MTFLRVLMAIACFVSAATSAIADDKSLKLQVAEVATSFIEPLPMDKKYVLKSLSPDATGIPEDFLRKLTSDVEAGLLFASDNAMNLINRDATEEIWQEATEFNSAQFQELYAKSSADVMIMISPRLTADGVEISLTAYELTGEDVGKVLASSGTSVLAMDVKATLGVDVNSIDAKLNSVLSAIQDSKPKPKTEKEMIEENTELFSRVGTFMPKFIADYGQPLRQEAGKKGSLFNEFYINGCNVTVASADEIIYLVRILGITSQAEWETGLAGGWYKKNDLRCDVLDTPLQQYMAAVESNITAVSEHSLLEFYNENSHSNELDNYLFLDQLTKGNDGDPMVHLVLGGMKHFGGIFTALSSGTWSFNCANDDQCRHSTDYETNDLYSGPFPTGGIRLKNIATDPVDIISQSPIFAVTQFSEDGFQREIGEVQDIQVSASNQGSDGVLKPTNWNAVFDFSDAFNAFKASGRIAIKKGIKDLGVYNGPMDSEWNDEVATGFQRIVDFLASNSLRTDFKAEYGLDQPEITHDNLLRFLNDLNCNSGGLLEGTAACS